VSVAPDGRSFAYVTHDSLAAAPLDGGAARLVAASFEVHSPAWSPDGRWIAFVSGNVQYISDLDLGNVAPSSVWVVAAAGGRPVRISDDRSLNASPAWAAPGVLLFVSDREGGRDVYQVGVSRSGRPVGTARRLTTGLNALGISVSSHGSRLAYAAFTETSNVWSLPEPARGTQSLSQARPVTVGNQTIENLGVSRDGRWLAFCSDRSGATQLYRQRLDRAGGEPEQVTTDTAPSYWAAWSPDGREVAFHRFNSERRQIFVTPVEGGRPVAVTDGSEDERSPEWDPEGRRLLVLANWATHPSLRVVTRGADGRWSGEHPLVIRVGPDTVTPGLGVWSPDGRAIACGCGPGGLVIVPGDGGAGRRLPSPYSTAGWAFPQWSADGRTVFHISEDSGRVFGVIAVPVDGRRPWVAIRFDDPSRPWHRFGFRVAAGRVFFTLGDRQSDIWVADVGRK
jgi:Tol biopolymer transport system component